MLPCRLTAAKLTLVDVTTSLLTIPASPIVDSIDQKSFYYSSTKTGVPSVRSAPPLRALPYPLSLVWITDYVHNVYVILNLVLRLLSVAMTYVHYHCLSLFTL